MLELETPSDVAQHLGRELGPSEWMTVDQPMIDKFADATGDHQWIHVDKERIARESPSWRALVLRSIHARAARTLRRTDPPQDQSALPSFPANPGATCVRSPPARFAPASATVASAAVRALFRAAPLLSLLFPRIAVRFLPQRLSMRSRVASSAFFPASSRESRSARAVAAVAARRRPRRTSRRDPAAIRPSSHLALQEIPLLLR